MKSFTFTLLAIALLLTLIPEANAQNTNPVRKGNWMIAGSIGYTSSSGKLHEENGESVSTLELLPELMYFVIDNLGIGVLLNYSSESGILTNTKYAIGPEIAYAFKIGNPNIIPFIGANVLFGSITTETEVNNVTVGIDQSTSTFVLKGGLLFMLNRTVGVHGTLYYASDSVQWDEISVEEDTRSGSRIGILFGLNAFLK
jgi:hypothetical protein